MVIQALKCKSKQIFFSRIWISMTFPWFFPGNGIPWFFHIREIFFTFSMISLISPWWWAPCIGIFKLKLQSGSAQVTVWKRSIRVKIGDFFFVPSDIGICRMTLKNNRAPLLCCFKLCASFHSHWWIKTGVTVRKRPIWVIIDDFFFLPCHLEIWQMTLKNNRVPLLSNIKLCASFQCHMRIQTRVTVPKWLNGVMTSVTLTFDLDLLHGRHFVNDNNPGWFQDDTMMGT